MLRILFLSLLPMAAHAADTFQGFMQDISHAEQQIDYSERLTPVEGIHNLIPAKHKDKNEKVKSSKTILKNEASFGQPEPIINKPVAGSIKKKTEPKTESKSVAKPKKRVKTSQEKAQKIEKKIKRSSSTYISPSLQMTNSAVSRKNTVATVFPETQGRARFGIYIGTKIPVQVFETVNNVQRGFIQLKTTRSVVGDKETLPAGSTFFARSSAVIGSDRVYLKVFKGLTPDGIEFNVGGSFISSEDDSFGLVGRIENDGKALSRAGDVAMNTLGRGLITSMPSATGVDALKDGGLSLLNENRQGARQENGRPVYIVVAEPQAGFIQILETF